VSEEIDMTSPEVKQAIADAVADEVKGLKAKNTELIDQVKKLRKNAEIDPADMAALEAERDELKSKLTEANKTANKAVKDAESAAKRADDLDAAYTNSIKDAALTEALTKANVTNPAYIKAAKAVLAAQASVAEENGARVVKAGDKALADFITEWAGSDEGKHFVTAPDTSGGGSQGGRGAPAKTEGDMGGDKAARIARANELLKQNSE
jgi:regulator of replication initiation timing